MRLRLIYLHSFLCPAQRWSRRSHNPDFNFVGPRSWFRDQAIIQILVLLFPWGHFCWQLLTYQPFHPRPQTHPLNHIKTTILILFWNLSTIILLFLFLQWGANIKQNRKIQDPYFLILQFLINRIFLLVSHDDPLIYIKYSLLLMILIRS